MEEILSYYEQPTLTEQQVDEIRNEAHEHLCNYLLGDGDIRYLYEYNDLMDKID